MVAFDNTYIFTNIKRKGNKKPLEKKEIIDMWATWTSDH